MHFTAFTPFILLIIYTLMLIFIKVLHFTCHKSCNTELAINDTEADAKPKTVTIFVVTPTYPRPTQMADMTRLSHTLSLVPDIFWIVSEDSNTKTKQLIQLLNRTRIPSVHLLSPRPNNRKDYMSGRGVSNRLKALQYLRQTYSKSDKQGVVYFADDDNAYDLRLFEEIRFTKGVSVFPVGLMDNIGLSTPVLNKMTGKVIGFHDPWLYQRKFAVDMAGFAVNLQLLLHRPRATFPYKVGSEEDLFIQELMSGLDKLEPKAKNCTEVLVWHSKTKPAIAVNYKTLYQYKGYKDTNLPILYNNILQ